MKSLLYLSSLIIIIAKDLLLKSHISSNSFIARDSLFNFITSFFKCNNFELNANIGGEIGNIQKGKEIYIHF